MFADTSPGRTGVEWLEGTGRVYVGVCDGKRVQSAVPFRDCEDLRPAVSASESWCGTGPFSEEQLERMERARESWHHKYKAEQERIANRSVLRVLRDTLHPFLRDS